MKAVVITFPGSNCNQEALNGLISCGFDAENVYYKDEIRDRPDLIFIPGGFSYGDYLRCGAISASTKIMQQVRQYSEHGVRIIGVCNGFQILTEAKLLDGALLQNECGHFVCKNVEIEDCQTKDIITMQVAHGDGRFYCDDKTLKELSESNLIAFKYKNNPNGSVCDIAGIFNRRKNIIGMMPHPERPITSHDNENNNLIQTISLSKVLSKLF